MLVVDESSPKCSKSAVDEPSPKWERLSSSGASQDGRSWLWKSLVTCSRGASPNGRSWLQKSLDPNGRGLASEVLLEKLAAEEPSLMWKRFGSRGAFPNGRSWLWKSRVPCGKGLAAGVLLQIGKAATEEPIPILESLAVEAFLQIGEATTEEPIPMWESLGNRGASLNRRRWLQKSLVLRGRDLATEAHLQMGEAGCGRA
ncbi:hypothetical protein Adt_02740 [Abeliophyllum distichum]|uniref:Uncharacterized protein n=1 Tax=Abeliophyllum distichum TaxID=126358 RepID=A0ABD1VWS3_9LAMI